MFSIGFTKTVAVIVGHSHSLFGEDSGEAPFLEFGGISAAFLCLLDKFLSDRNIPLMINTDFGNDESRISISNGFVS
jgi:hypothetical protein